MKNVEDKLELFSRVYCLGLGDIEKVFKGDQHLLDKYVSCRDEEGANGNFKFISILDSGNASKFFDYLGLRDVVLEDKDSLPKSVKFIKDLT